MVYKIYINFESEETNAKHYTEISDMTMTFHTEVGDYEAAQLEAARFLKTNFKFLKVNRISVHIYQH